MKYCQFCGKPANDIAKYCELCGRPYYVPTNNYPPPLISENIKSFTPTNVKRYEIKNKWVIVIVVGIIIFLCKCSTNIFKNNPLVLPTVINTIVPTKTPQIKSTEPLVDNTNCFGLEYIESDPYGVSIYTTSDELLDIRGTADSVEKIGEDTLGMIVNWTFPDSVYTLKRREENGITAYRVVEICSK